jgi:CheY-like chemotaxis protein
MDSFIGKSILLAEDNIDNQQLILNMAEIMQFKVDIANNGQEVIDKWKKNKYDLIMMDIQMPEMDGFQATAEIRKLEKGKGHTLILALTASVLSEDIQKCLEVGMDSYLNKPITFNMLERKLSDIFSKSKTTDSQ